MRIKLLLAFFVFVLSDCATESLTTVTKPTVTKPTVTKPSIIKPSIIKPSTTKPSTVRQSLALDEVVWKDLGKSSLKSVFLSLDDYPDDILARTKNWKGIIFQDHLKDGSLGPKMVGIPAGSFQMGSNESVDEKPIHEVYVDRFAMGQTEVTFTEYDKFVQATGRSKPDDKGWGRGNRPVINVSWHDANAYAKWLSQQTGKKYRLPTEAEWEYAARAGTTTKYWWGNTASHEYMNYGTDDCCDSLAKGKDRWKYAAPVGSFSANPFGIYDTAGNVWEWVSDIYSSDYYSSSPSSNPKGPGGGAKLAGFA